MTNTFNSFNKMGMSRNTTANGEPHQKTVPEKCILKAFKFLFPDKSENSSLYWDFQAFVQRQFNKIDCVVLYTLNPRFKWFLDSHRLSIGTKEVIIPSNFVVRATKNFRISPEILP